LKAFIVFQFDLPRYQARAIMERSMLTM